MSNLLWFSMLILSGIPCITCLVYYYRRLGSRRTLLKNTLTSMDLAEDYMRMRHPDCTNPAKDFDVCFDRDFREGLSASDYFWPVLLVTVICLIGWFLGFSRVYPSFSRITEAHTFLPEAFAFGFAGAYLASLLSIFEDFRTLNLDPSAFYSVAGRLLFSSTAAYLVGQTMKDTFSILVAVGIGLIPVEEVRDFIVNRTSQATGTVGAEGERGLGLNVIQGLEDRLTRKQLVDMNIATVQALATSDPFWLFFQTTLPLRTIVDMIDKAILYLYIGDTVKELRTHGINGVIELVALAKLAAKEPAYDVGDAPAAEIGMFFEQVDPVVLTTKVAAILKQDPDELRAFIYNCFYDPQISLLYEIWGKYYNPKTTHAKLVAKTTVPKPAPANPSGVEPAVTVVQNGGHGPAPVDA
jgi:hypothetical protein